MPTKQESVGLNAIITLGKITFINFFISQMTIYLKAFRNLQCTKELLLFLKTFSSDDRNIK